MSARLAITILQAAAADWYRKIGLAHAHAKHLSGESATLARRRAERYERECADILADCEIIRLAHEHDAPATPSGAPT